MLKISIDIWGDVVGKPRSLEWMLDWLGIDVVVESKRVAKVIDVVRAQGIVLFSW